MRFTPSLKACDKAAPAMFRKLPCTSNDLLSDFSKGDNPLGKGVHFLFVVANKADDDDCLVEADGKANEALARLVKTTKNKACRIMAAILFRLFKRKKLTQQRALFPMVDPKISFRSILFNPPNCVTSFS